MDKIKKLTPKVPEAVFNDRLISEAQLADALPNMTLRKLADWRPEGRGPVFIKKGREFWYRTSAVDEWLSPPQEQTTSTDVPS